MFDHLSLPVRWTLLGIVVALTFASLLIAVLRIRTTNKDYTEVTLRLRTWWVIVGLFSLSLVVLDGRLSFDIVRRLRLILRLCLCLRIAPRCSYCDEPVCRRPCERASTVEVCKRWALSRSFAAPLVAECGRGRSGCPPCCRSAAMGPGRWDGHRQRGSVGHRSG